jgi:hypothetical protein
VMGVVGSMSESRRAVEEIARLKASFAGQPLRRDAAEGAPEPAEQQPAEPELSERELAFIKQSAALMDRYCKPIANISFTPINQAVFSVGGRYSALVLPSPLRAVKILGKMAAYSGYLRKKGRDLGC